MKLWSKFSSSVSSLPGTGGRSSFDRLTVKSRSSRFFLNERAYFCLSRFKVDETSKTRMAQSREICRFWPFDRTVLTVWPADFKYQTVLTVTDQDFMNRDEIKRDENGQNMFVHRCLFASPSQDVFLQPLIPSIDHGGSFIFLVTLLYDQCCDLTEIVRLIVYQDKLM